MPKWWITSPWPILDHALHGNDPGARLIIGYTTKNSGGCPDNFRNYFVIVFDRPFTNTAIFDGDALDDTKLEDKSNHTGSVIGFSIAKRGDQVYARVASSFISPEQAEINQLRCPAESTKTEARRRPSGLLKRTREDCAVTAKAATSAKRSRRKRM